MRRNVTFKNSRIGNVTDEKAALLGGWSSPASMNVVFDNVEFHDVVPGRRRGPQRVRVLDVPGPHDPQLDVPELRDDGPDDHARRLVGPAHLRRRDAREQRLRTLHERPRPGWHDYGFLVHGNMGQLTNARIVNNTFETASAASPTPTSAPRAASGPTTSAAAGTACPA